MTSEDDFHRLLDESPTDWHTRLVFADWLEERGDPRAAGYRAIAARRRHPLRGRHNDSDTWWWHSSSDARVEEYHNHIPADWFGRLPAGEGNESFWPVFRTQGGVKSRRECEDALARAFAALPPERRAELLALTEPAAK